MVIALVGGADRLCLLRRMGDGREAWYEYVGDASMCQLDVEIHSLDEFGPGLKLERLEIR